MNNLISHSNNLPLTLISMEEWSLLVVSGPDNINYMQNQLTCDINLIKKNNFSFAAHCNSSGKTIGFLCVFYYNEDIILIVRSNLVNKHLLEFKKYSIFFNINIQISTELSVLGIAGFQAKYFIKNLFYNSSYKIKPVNYNEETCIIHINLPKSRFLIITTISIYNSLLDKFKNKIQINNSKQWISLDIESGYPIIDNINSELFVPQSINIKSINGISFNKGCYIGQEVIAKIEYKKINKYSLYWLQGYSNYIPNAGMQLEIKINKHWKKVGKVLTACKTTGNDIWIQSVLNNIVNNTSSLRIHDDKSSLFKVCPLC